MDVVNDIPQQRPNPTDGSVISGTQWVGDWQTCRARPDGLVHSFHILVSRFRGMSLATSSLHRFHRNLRNVMGRQLVNLQGWAGRIGTSITQIGFAISRCVVGDVRLPQMALQSVGCNASGVDKLAGLDRTGLYIHSTYLVSGFRGMSVATSNFHRVPRNRRNARGYTC